MQRMSWMGPWVKSIVTLAVTITHISVCVSPAWGSLRRNLNQFSSMNSSAGSSPQFSSCLSVHLWQVSNFLSPSCNNCLSSEHSTAYVLYSLTLFLRIPLVSHLVYDHHPYSMPSRVLCTQRPLITNINWPLRNSCITRIWNRWLHANA